MKAKIAVFAMAFAILLSSYPTTAQQSEKVYRIGVLGTSSERVQGVFVEPLRNGLRAVPAIDGRPALLRR